MSLPIFWNDNAKEDYANLLIGVERQFGTDAALKIIEAVDKLMEQITVFPKSCKASQKFPNVRKATILKHTSLIYILKPNEIEILFLWDNRENPYRHSDLF